MKDHVVMKSPQCGASFPDLSSRRRFWEIDSYFKCPLVGMCLTPAEQRQLLKKTGISFKRKSAFEIHEILVAGSENENLLSRRVDNFLSGKFSREAVELWNLAENGFLMQWRSRFRTADAKGAFWVAATRPDLSTEARREIFGDVHMEMHNTGDQIAKLKRLLDHEQAMRHRADERHRRETACRKGLEKEQADLRQSLRELNNRLAFMEREKVALSHEIMKLRGGAVEILEQENNGLRADIDVLSAKVNDYAHRLTVLQKENQRLLEDWGRQCELSAHISDELEVVLHQCLDMGECRESCPSFDLCRKRVLIVGGVTRMESLYRELIEGSGGIFEYHDGNLKNGSRKLESSLKRADVVLCPVTCNSHAACQMVKKLGKKYNKPIHMLTSSGLTGVSQVLGNG